ncbi:SMODS-associated NUDIX domain-containing protein [Streptomyces poriticola]|uniref:SMODS-associated NUDIX domain-containing protein n=1 Tax=Streptomyces poriticola TaxID=3120506 RepID=UPI002FCE1AD9
MVEKVVGGLVLALLTFAGRTLWQNRRHLRLLLVLATPWRQVRVSVAVLLRVHDEDRFVLFTAPTRPGAFGPPGGVVKYREPAFPALERLGFACERRNSAAMRFDLRGFLPAARVLAFARWLQRGDGREPWTEGLRRELLEELGEVGHDELAEAARNVAFQHVRRVIDGPMQVAGESYSQIRFFEVFDLVPDRSEAAELRATLIALANDATEVSVIGATRREITLGRAGVHVVLPQSAFLIGDRRYRGDIHPVS